MSYRERVGQVAAWLRREGLSAAFIEDDEARRNPSLRYLTGHPEDARLFLLATGKSLLLPWDANLARSIATADEIIPFTNYRRDPATAFAAIVQREGLTGQVELSAGTPHLSFQRFREAVPHIEMVCRERGLDEELDAMRAVKKDAELASMRRAAEITNELLARLETRLRESTETGLLSEVDVALFLELEARRRGAEGMSFETIAAGPTRSYGIHAFPSYGAGPFGSPGLSILDFGVQVAGYRSDVTVTVARGPLSAKQDEMIHLVEEAYLLAVSLVRPGRPTREIAHAVDELFARSGYSMPHSLGHGLGLEVHEAPLVNNRDTNHARLEPGMIITIEPGLYDPTAGGARYENDFLITEEGCEALTNARILRLP